MIVLNESTQLNDTQSSVAILLYLAKKMSPDICQYYMWTRIEADGV